MYEGGYKATLDERETETGSFSLAEPSPEDLAEAADWYRKAAGQEDAGAEAALGWMYRNGSGVPKDEVEAVKWYRRAACQGNSSAQLAMGAAYENGRGVPRDDAKAHAWFSLDDYPTHYDLQKRTLARLHTKEERDRARRLAAKYRGDYLRPFAW